MSLTSSNPLASLVNLYPNKFPRYVSSYSSITHLSHDSYSSITELLFIFIYTHVSQCLMLSIWQCVRVHKEIDTYAYVLLHRKDVLFPLNLISSLQCLNLFPTGCTGSKRTWRRRPSSPPLKTFVFIGTTFHSPNFSSLNPVPTGCTDSKRTWRRHPSPPPLKDTSLPLNHISFP